MTDPFEDAVRDAVRELATTGEPPTYHQAWQRGRRRRTIKSVGSIASALLLVVSLGAVIGNLAGGRPVERDELVLGADATVATTAPVFVEPTPPGPTTSGSSQSGLSASAPGWSGSRTDTIDSAAADPTPTPVSIPTGPAATDQPALAQSPTETAEPDMATTEPAGPATSSADAADTTSDATSLSESGLSESGLSESGLSTADPDVVHETEEGPVSSASEGAQAATSTVVPAEAMADAVVVGTASSEATLCDIDADGVADARCGLLGDYSCTSGEVLPGYVRVDLDGDGSLETCTAIGVTTCDTTGDGIGDTACIIEFLAVELSDQPQDVDTKDPADSSNDG